MPRTKEPWIAGVLVLLYLVILTVPFIYAGVPTASGRVFGGFLINPIDGNSYLAKMRQGYQGNWLFTLPYTSEPGAGAAINLYYLFLGHIARIFQLSLIFTFHLARLLGALLLALALYRFIASIFEQSNARLFAFGLALFGSGLGWLAVPFGLFTSDFWVSEAFPFLSGLTNPHFVLGLALQVLLLTPMAGTNRMSPISKLLTLAAAIALSLVYAFGWVVAVGVLTAWVVWLLFRKALDPNEKTRWFLVLLGGAPYAPYAWWIVNNHAVLAQWNAQNVTPAPAIFDLLVSFSPPLVFALWVALAAFQRKENKLQILAIWVLVGVALVYFPFNLQRRLISGLYVPTLTLAVYGVQELTARPRKFATALLILAIPTNVLILGGALQGVRNQASQLFISRSEAAGFAWLDENAAPGSLVLASPETGLLIPAYSDARVVYGHPFETVDAESEREATMSFFSGHGDATGYLEAEGIDYIFYGPRERDIGPLPEIANWEAIAKFGDVEIWAELQ